MPESVDLTHYKSKKLKVPKRYEGDLKAEGHQEHDVVRGEKQD